MASQKSSPVPRLVTDEELNRYQRVSLRLTQTKTQGDVVYVCLRDPLRGGRQTSRRAGTTREQILAALDAASQWVSEYPPDPLRDPLTPFAVVAEAWFDHATSNGLLARATLENKRAFYEAHLRESLGARPIRDIGCGLLRLQMRRLEAEDIGASARSKTQAVLKDVFRWAKREGYICVDPTKDLEAIGTPKPDRRHDFLTPEEVKHLLDPNTLERLESQHVVRRATFYHAHLRFLTETGCRPGEMAAVRDSDLNLSEHSAQSYVWIRHSRDGREVKSPKTAAGVRKIPISDGLAGELRRYINIRDELFVSTDHMIALQHGTSPAPDNPLGFTFTSPWGRPLNLRQFGKVFRRICLQAGINTWGVEDKAIVPHPYTLRRTFLTHLAEAGTPQSTMMALAGHSDFRATQRYLGATEDAQRQAIAGLWDRLELDGSPPPQPLGASAR